MTIEINALVIVQMFNFFVAYCILRFIILEPGLKVVNEFDTQKQLLLGDLALLQEEIERREAVNAEQRERHTSVLQSRIPKNLRVYEKESSGGEWHRVERLSPEKEAQLVGAMKETIINQLKQGRS